MAGTSRDRASPPPPWFPPLDSPLRGAPTNKGIPKGGHPSSHPQELLAGVFGGRMLRPTVPGRPSGHLRGKMVPLVSLLVGQTRRSTSLLADNVVFPSFLPISGSNDPRVRCHCEAHHTGFHPPPAMDGRDCLRADTASFPSAPRGSLIGTRLYPF
jgi:hypothetical protein